MNNASKRNWTTRLRNGLKALVCMLGIPARIEKCHLMALGSSLDKAKNQFWTRRIAWRWDFKGRGCCNIFDMESVQPWHPLYFVREAALAGICRVLENYSGPGLEETKPCLHRAFPCKQ